MDLDRQMRLAEVGVEGQARITRHVFALPAGDAVARDYARRAGAEHFVDQGDDGAPHAAAFAFEATRAVGTSAWRALRELRRALAEEQA